MRRKIKKYDELVAFRISKGSLRGLEIIASKKRIGVSELIRNCLVELLSKRKKI